MAVLMRMAIRQRNTLPPCRPLLRPRGFDYRAQEGGSKRLLAAPPCGKIAAFAHPTMCPYWSRRDVLKGLVAASATWIQPATGQAVREDEPSSPLVEIQVTPISSHTFRLSILQAENGSAVSIPSDGSLSQESWRAPVARLRSDPGRQIDVGISRLTINFHPVTILVKNDK